MGYPAGTAYKIPITVSAAKVAGALSYFPYQIDLSAKLASDAVFKSRITTAKNIAVYDPVTDTRRPSVVLLDLANNKLLIVFDASATTSTDKNFFVCAGAGIDYNGAIECFTNSGYTNYWGFNEFSVNTIVDWIALSTATIDNVGVVRGAAKFGNGLCINSATAYATLNKFTPLVNSSLFTTELLFKKTTNLENGIIFAQRAGATNLVQYHTNAGNMRIQVSNGTNAYGSFSLSGYPQGNWYHLVVVYNGSGAANEDRLKVYMNGSPVSLTFTLTIPASILCDTPALLGYATLSNIGCCDELSALNIAATNSFITTRYNQFVDAGFLSVGSGSVVGSKAVKFPLSPRGYGYSKRY